MALEGALQGRYARHMPAGWRGARVSRNDIVRAHVQVFEHSLAWQVYDKYVFSLGPFVKITIDQPEQDTCSWLYGIHERCLAIFMHTHATHTESSQLSSAKHIEFRCQYASRSSWLVLASIPWDRFSILQIFLLLLLLCESNYRHESEKK